MVIFSILSILITDHLIQTFFFGTADRLPSLLMFCNGVNQIPPLGFHSPDKIAVLQLQPECGPLPNANTCPQELDLLCMHDKFEDFKESLNKALDIQGSGFGIV